MSGFNLWLSGALTVLAIMAAAEGKAWWTALLTVFALLNLWAGLTT